MFVHVCTGIDAARGLGISPILSADEMIHPHEGHLGVMAYAAHFMKLPPVKKSSAHMVEIIFNSVDISPGSRVSVTLNKIQ